MQEARAATKARKTATKATAIKVAATSVTATIVTATKNNSNKNNTIAIKAILAATAASTTINFVPFCFLKDHKNKIGCFRYGTCNGKKKVYF